MADGMDRGPDEAVPVPGSEPIKTAVEKAYELHRSRTFCNRDGCLCGLPTQDDTPSEPKVGDRRHLSDRGPDEAVTDKVLRLMEERYEARLKNQKAALDQLMGKWFGLQAWLEERVEDHSSDGRVLDEGLTYENVLARMQEDETEGQGT